MIPSWLSGSSRSFLCSSSVSLVAQIVKNLPAMQETQFLSLGWEDPLEKGMTTHSSIVASKDLETYPYRNLNVDVYSSFSHNFQEVEATKMSFSG